MYEIEQSELSGVTDFLKGLGNFSLEQILKEVEDRAKKGAEEAVKTPLFVSYGIGALGIILGIIALIRR